MNENNEFVLSDEAIAEQGKIADAGDDLRTSIAEFLGLTDDDDTSDLLDRFTEREQNLRKGYGELLGRKYIPLKKAYQNLVNDPRFKEEKGKSDFDPEAFRKEVQVDTLNSFNEQYLDESDFSDEFKIKVKEELNRNPGKTAQFVLKNSDYLNFLKDKESGNRRAQEAANNGTGQSGSKRDGDGSIPEKFIDPKFMSTEKGRKEFDEWSQANSKD